MNIHISPTKHLASVYAASQVVHAIRHNPKLVLGLATGKTMIPFYRELVRAYRHHLVDFSRVTTFNLDTYADALQGDFPSFMHKHFFHHVNVDSKRMHFPGKDGKKYEQLIQKSGGIDVQILGLGRNGHIAFNEPGSSERSKTRRVHLALTTVKANFSWLDRMLGRTPLEAYTMGVGTIKKAKRIYILAFGTSKARAVRLAVEGHKSKDVPASLLRSHKHLTYVLDAKAASQLHKA